MKNRPRGYLSKYFKVWLIVPLLMMGVFVQIEAQAAFTVNVKTEDLDAAYQPKGTYSLYPAGFRFVVERDNSFYPIPGTPDPVAPWPDPSNTLGSNIHRSHAPVICSGDTGAMGSTATVDPWNWTDPATGLKPCQQYFANQPAGPWQNPLINPEDGTTASHYIISVIPWHQDPIWGNGPNGSGTANTNGPFFQNQKGAGLSGRVVSGTEFTGAPKPATATTPAERSSVDIIVARFPNPTAQVTVLVFNDNRPLNAAYDQPDEIGLGGFGLLLNDPLGKVMQDAWGNPIGTTYVMAMGANGRPKKSANGSYTFLDTNGCEMTAGVPLGNGCSGVPQIDFAGNGTLTSCPGPGPLMNTPYNQANCTDLDTGAPLAAGEAVIRFLPANRMSVEPIPPGNDPGWILTGTLEGTRSNDAWVRSKEPRFNIINGQLNWLVFFGEVKICDAFNGHPCAGVVTPRPARNVRRGEIKGRVTMVHDIHPPYAPGINSGTPIPNCYAALNNLSGSDEIIAVQPCDKNSRFDFKNIPAGNYQLAVWDKEINQIIDYRTVTIPPAGGLVDLQDVAIYSWFCTALGSVFYDSDGTGLLPLDPTAAKPGISNMRVNLRYSDGALYQSQLTDSTGHYAFNQVFPFWRWMAIESDVGTLQKTYGLWQSTGMTAVVDAGGNPAFATTANNNNGFDPAYPQYRALGINPQIQAGGQPYRVQNDAESEVELYNIYQDMTQIVNFGKKPYAAGTNGGIKGFISYATSRTQEDPAASSWQSWEPGVPRVPLSLYYAVQACVDNVTGAVVAGTNQPGSPCPATATLKWLPSATAGGAPAVGAGNIPLTGAALLAIAVNSDKTDSFDDNNPTGCDAVTPPWLNGVPGFNAAGQQVDNVPTDMSGNPTGPGVVVRDCAETLRTWNQVRPGVFDGSYAFRTTSTGAPLAAGNYIVKADLPSGYKMLSWGSRNIEFGEPNSPYSAYPPACVGPAYAVPKFHQLFPDWQISTFYPGFNQTPTGPVSTWYCKSSAAEAAPGTGYVDQFGYCHGSSSANPVTLDPAIGPVAYECTMKATTVVNGQNQIVDFRMFTDVPKASKMWGWVSDDLHLESNPYSPNASANFSPSFLPAAIRDWAGKTVWAGYTDQWGRFTGIIPSTYTIYSPNPLGMSAGVYTVDVNQARAIVKGSDLTGMPIICDGTQTCNGTLGDRSCCVMDPWFRPEYGQETIRENWDFYAGRTTFIDTIVIPDSAVISRIPLNCDVGNGTPEIKQVTSNDALGGGPVVTTGDSLTILSVGLVEVPNPDFNPNLAPGPANPAKVPVNHGFGAAGTVTVNGTALTGVTWSDAAITGTVPAGAKTGELIVTIANPNGSGTLSSVVGLTIHVYDPAHPPVVREVFPPDAACDPYTDGTQCLRIQPVINTASPGDIILVHPNTQSAPSYMENPILYTPVILQSYGAPITNMDGTAALGNLPGKDAWNTLFQALVGATCAANTDCISIPPGTINDFTFEQGAGFMIVGCDWTSNTCHNDFRHFPSQIDGFTIWGASEAGGGVYANSYAQNLKVTNNIIFANQGNQGGGVRVGSQALVNGTIYTNSHNENVVIDHNQITQNGSLSAGGGGVSLYKGCDNYQVTSNMICGNFAIVYGGGILVQGYSPNGVVRKNVIVSNESFDEGGGAMFAGDLPIAAAGVPLTSEGVGSTIFDDNLLQGNKGGDDGGGLRTLMFNGQDFELNPNNRLPNARNNRNCLFTSPLATPTRSGCPQWYSFTVTNNMIVDNSSGDHGGGIALDDTVLAYIFGNTIAHNVSTSTGSGAFTNGACVVGEPNGQTCPPGAGEIGIGGTFVSTPRVGGIASYFHSTALANILASIPNARFPNNNSPNLKLYANPFLYNDIIWQNQSYYWDPAANQNFGAIVVTPAGQGHAAGIWDIAVYNSTTPGAPNSPGNLLNTHNCILTDGVGATTAAANHNKIGTDPLFVSPYFNVYEASSKGAAFGNFVNVYYNPIGLMSYTPGPHLYGDYHLSSANSPANSGGAAAIPGIPAAETVLLFNVTPPAPQGLATTDYDAQARSTAIGADQFNAVERWFPF